MLLQETDTKRIFSNCGIKVPVGRVAANGEEALAVYDDLNMDGCVVKAQVLTGGRGLSGGIIKCDKSDLAATVDKMIGTRLVTYQTDAHGLPIHRVLIESLTNIVSELYLGAVIDRATQSIVVMASTEGGMDIEKVADESPEKIIKIAIDPNVGCMPYQCRQVAYRLGLNHQQVKQFTKIMMSLVKLFIESDMVLVEINPLAIDDKGDLVCLDGKVSIDDNALYRQHELTKLRDETQEDPRENIAKRHELNYISLQGNIGCMVNGAGLAMATMDLIKLKGGQPANFLDVGGGATAERVAEAFKIILSDEHVQAILINIFGGIVRCDLIADGILQALQEVEVKVPVVVRLEGNNASLGLQKLEESGLNIIAAKGFEDAAEQVVASVEK